MAEPGCLHDAHFQNLETSGLFTMNGFNTTEIDSDLSSHTTVKKTVVLDNLVKYEITFDCGTTGIDDPGGTADDIIGKQDLGSTLVKLPSNFILLNGAARTSKARGATFKVNIVLSSQNSKIEDTPLTDDFSLLTNLDGNSASTTFTTFQNIDSTGSRPSLYLTNNGTGNAGVLTTFACVIVLVGQINNGSIPIAPNYGGRKMAIGYTPTEFKTNDTSTIRQFNTKAGTAAAAGVKLTIPKGAFITAVFIKSSIQITSGGSATLTIGLD
jgi:hypothetical protein